MRNRLPLCFVLMPVTLMELREPPDPRRVRLIPVVAYAVERRIAEPETTARNQRLIRECRDRRGDALAWAAELETELDRRAKA